MRIRQESLGFLSPIIHLLAVFHLSNFCLDMSPTPQSKTISGTMATPKINQCVVRIPSFEANHLPMKMFHRLFLPLIKLLSDPTVPRLVLLIGFVLTSGLAQVQANSRVIATIPVGSFPDGIVVSPDSSTVYVSDEVTNTVSVIDSVTNTLTATIPVGPVPGSLAITPDGLTLYVLLQGIDGVQVINTATKTAGTVFGAGSIATQLAVSPDGKYLYSISESGIEIVSTTTNTFVAEIMTGSNPAYEIVFSPEGNYAYALCALNYGTRAADGILQINTVTLQQDQLLWGKLSDANNITITPDGNKLYIGTLTASGTGAIEVYKISKNTILQSIPVPQLGGIQAAITPDGKYLYYPDAGDVYVIKTTNNKVVGSPIPIGTDVLEVAIGPNGQHAYAISSGNSGGIVSVIDIQTRGQFE
jgi:YVTN family beta-propeller protein